MPRVVVPVTEITPPTASLTTALTGTHNDLVFTAKSSGPGGNNIRVKYVVAGASTPLSVVVEGFDITVNVATSAGSAAVSTAAEVKAALQASADVKALITIALAASNDGSGVVTALSFTALAGGALGIAAPAAVDGDATNDHYLTGNDGLVHLEVVSTDAGSQTVTVHYAPNVLAGVSVSPAVETIAAGATRRLGPFPQKLFNQNAARDVYFDPSVSTTLKFRAWRLTPA